MSYHCIPDPPTLVFSATSSEMKKIREHHILVFKLLLYIDTCNFFQVDAPLSNVSIDFDSPASKVKFKVNGIRTPFTAYTITDSSSAINFLLPSRETKSFSPSEHNPLITGTFSEQVL